MLDKSEIYIKELTHTIVNTYKLCYEEMGYDLGDTNNEVEYHNYLISDPLRYYTTYNDVDDASILDKFILKAENYWKALQEFEEKHKDQYLNLMLNGSLNNHTPTFVLPTFSEYSDMYTKKKLSENIEKLEEDQKNIEEEIKREQERIQEAEREKQKLKESLQAYIKEEEERRRREEEDAKRKQKNLDAKKKKEEEERRRREEVERKKKEAEIRKQQEEAERKKKEAERKQKEAEALRQQIKNNIRNMNNQLNADIKDLPTDMIQFQNTFRNRFSNDFIKDTNRCQYAYTAFNALLKYGEKAGLKGKKALLLVYAQFIQESKYFMHKSESGGQKYLQKQEYYPYYGRGPIQITWERNYRAIKNEWFPQIGIHADIVKDPDLLVRDLNIGCAASLGWFTLEGNGKRAVAAANRGDVKRLSKAINGGDNGLDDRIKITNNLLKIFNMQ